MLLSLEKVSTDLSPPALTLNLVKLITINNFTHDPGAFQTAASVSKTKERFCEPPLLPQSYPTDGQSQMLRGFSFQCRSSGLWVSVRGSHLSLLRGTTVVICFPLVNCQPRGVGPQQTTFWPTYSSPCGFLFLFLVAKFCPASLQVGPSDGHSIFSDSFVVSMEEGKFKIWCGLFSS